MARNKSNSFYTIAKNYKIFIIICRKTNEFFVKFSSAQRLDKTFTRHYTLKNSCTSKMFSLYRETIYCPEMFQLEELLCTGDEAYVRQLLWIRYFLSFGYHCLNYPQTIEDAKNIYEERYSDYKEIKKNKVDDVFSTANRRCANYGRYRQEIPEEEKDGKKQVKFFCTNEEYQIIQAHARENDLTVSAYLREVAIQGKVININYPEVAAHRKEFLDYKNKIVNLVNLLCRTRVIYDSDIERIIDIQKSIDKSSNKLLGDFLKQTQKYRKLIKEELKKQIL